MPPTTPHADLPRYIQFFFQELAKAPPEGAGRAVGTLASLKVMAGVYTDYTGTGFDHFGQRLRPDFVIRVAKTLVTMAGAQPSMAGVQLTEGQYEQHDVYYLQERGDAAFDTRETLARLFREVPQGDAWAQAIAATPDRATFFRRPLREISAAPPNSPVPDAGALVALLAHHCTYDQTGAFYGKWPGDAPGQFPAGVTPDYRQKAMREVELARDEFYCLAVVPARLMDQQANERAMREFLVHLEQGQGDGPPQMRLVYSVARAEAAQPFHQFCFFYTDSGRGIQVPVTARSTLQPGLASFLSGMPRENLDAYLERSRNFHVEQVGGQRVTYLFGTIKAGAALQNLPAGVQMTHPGAEGQAAPTARAGDDDDAVASRARLFTCPIDKVVELAAHADVETLTECGYSTDSVVTARGNIHHGAFLTELGLTPATDGGRNVMVGIVDSGIDGSHPAFTGRIHAVWDMTVTPASNPPSTTGDMNFGSVLTGAATANAVDPGGHGTHVAGIAAGAAGTGYTYSGIAPRASICVVRLRGSTGATAAAREARSNRDILLGMTWIFNQARAAGMPCVINRSGGTHDHGHDGTDALSLLLRGLVRSGDTYHPGRIICASVGNERQYAGHSHVESLAPGATHSFRIWVRSPANLATVTAGFGGESPPSDLKFRFFARPIPAATRGCTVSVRVVRSPGPGTSAWVAPRRDFTPLTPQPTIAGTQLEIVNGPPMPYTRHAQPWVIFKSVGGAPIQSGDWVVEIQNTSTVAVEVHGYCVDTLNWRSFAAFFRDATEKCLMKSPSVAAGLIACGSTNNIENYTDPSGAAQTNTGWRIDRANAAGGFPIVTVPAPAGVFSGFSNPGPVRGSPRNIVATAPGDPVISANSKQASPTGPTAVVMGGTSMSTPIITGLAACLLEKIPTMTAEQYKEKLNAHITRPTGGSADDYGPGQVDARNLWG